MKNVIRQALYFLLIKVFKIKPDSILYFAYYTNNIRPGHDLAKNGELHFLNNVKEYYRKNKKITVFDVGANDGTYSKLLSSTFENANIFAFEPNFELVKMSDYGAAKIYSIGLGDKKAQANLFLNGTDSQEASIHEGVATFLSTATDTDTKVLDIELDSLDNFCQENGITKIEFLKIDTEGNEYAVLLGAKRMLATDNIEIIQFEFNEMNVISRVFLKDFYDLLIDNYEIFRLHKAGLYPLANYKSHNEIFVWHNLVAINKKVVHKFKA